MITQITVLTWLVRTLNRVSLPRGRPAVSTTFRVTACTPMSPERASRRIEVRLPGPRVTGGTRSIRSCEPGVDMARPTVTAWPRSLTRVTWMGPDSPDIITNGGPSMCTLAISERRNPVVPEVWARARSASARALTEEPSSATLDRLVMTASSSVRSTPAKTPAVRIKLVVAARLDTGTCAARSEVG
jgi:hypothetical protein